LLPLIPFEGPVRSQVMLLLSFNGTCQMSETSVC